MIEALHTKYNLERDNYGLSGIDKTLPLQILNPDNNGATALQLSISS